MLLCIDPSSKIKSKGRVCYYIEFSMYAAHYILVISFHNKLYKEILFHKCIFRVLWISFLCFGLFPNKPLEGMLWRNSVVPWPSRILGSAGTHRATSGSCQSCCLCFALSDLPIPLSSRCTKRGILRWFPGRSLHPVQGHAAGASLCSARC